ncbi:hypothetical protein Efla_004380 [Eimeria flavescens]
MLLPRAEESGSSSSQARLRRRLFSGSSAPRTETAGLKAAAFSRFLSDTCLSAAHIPPPAASPLCDVEGLGPLEGAPPDLLGALDLLGAPLAHDFGRYSLTHQGGPLRGGLPLSPPCKRKGGAPSPARQRLLACHLPPVHHEHAAAAYPLSARLTCEADEGGPYALEKALLPLQQGTPPPPGALPAAAACREAARKSKLNEWPRPSKKPGLLMAPHLLQQLPVVASAAATASAGPASSSSNNLSSSGSKGRRKAPLLSPAYSGLNVSSSPLSVISQASTTCALLSSASSFDSCSQPPTPYYGLLEVETPLSLSSRAPSALPLTPPPQPAAQVEPHAHAAAAAGTAAATAACEAAPKAQQQIGSSQCPRSLFCGISSYTPPQFADSPQQQVQHLANDAAEAAAAAAAGGATAVAAAAGAAAQLPAKATEAAALAVRAKQQTAPAAKPSDDSTVATSFLSSPKPKAASSPLRLPIPSRGLRRLQHPRLQQQPPAAEDKRSSASSSCPQRSLRRLQLPRLRAPPSSLLDGSVCELGGACSSSYHGQHVAAGWLSPGTEAPLCMHGSSLADEQYAHRRPSPTPADCGCCGGACGQSGAPSRAPGGAPLGDAFEAAAHAAHVAAHAAARAAAHAAAHAAVLKRRAAEAYWCSRSSSHATFSIYPDLDRDIHQDYNLYCAAWPDAAAGPSGKPQQDASESMSIDAPPATQRGRSPAGDLKSGKAAKGHLVLGEGRYGKVVLAEHKRTHEMVAVKMLDKRRALADDTWDCRQELEMHRRLPRHPHVVSVLDVYEDRKSLYILMELCNRNTLVDRIVSDGAFTEEQAKLIFAQLLSGVMHCHNNNIVHRDLKPENILFAREAETHKFPPPEYCPCRCSSGDRSYPPFHSSYESSSSPSPQGVTSTVKITDFGSACYAVPGELNGTACGTIHYLAPEVLAGNYYDGFLSDVWSLGVILYIIISATPPFYGDSDGEVLQKIVAGSYSLNGYAWRQVSDDCKDIIRRLLTVDPRCRMSLNEAVSHPWFARATAGLGYWVPLLSCPHCSLQQQAIDEAAEEKLCDEELEGVCCGGGCHGEGCEAAALVLRPPPCSCLHSCRRMARASALGGPPPSPPSSDESIGCCRRCRVHAQHYQADGSSRSCLR